MANLFSLREKEGFSNNFFQILAIPQKWLQQIIYLKIYVADVVHKFTVLFQ